MKTEPRAFELSTRPPTTAAPPQRAVDFLRAPGRDAADIGRSRLAALGLPRPRSVPCHPCFALSAGGGGMVGGVLSGRFGRRAVAACLDDARHSGDDGVPVRGEPLRIVGVAAICPEQAVGREVPGL